MQLFSFLEIGIDIDAGCGQLKADLLRKIKKINLEGKAENSTGPNIELEMSVENVAKERERTFSECT